MNKTLLIAVLGIISTIIIVAILTQSDPKIDESGNQYEEINIQAVAEEESEDLSVGISETTDTLSEVDIDAAYSEFDLSFAHTAPGEFSEIFILDSNLPPGEKVIVYLKRTGSDEYEGTGHEAFIDEAGYLNTKFQVFTYGSYDVEIHYGAKGIFTETIEVK